MNCNKQDPISARFYMLDAAVARDDARQALKHIYCDGGNIVATNGKILVYTNNDEALKPGFYDLVTTGTGRDKRTKFVPVTDEKAKDWHYPNWKMVVPDCTNCKKLEFRGKAEIRELEVFKLQFALASCGKGSLIGQEFIDLVCKPQLTCTVRIVDGLVPVLFEVTNFYSVLVMPKRVSVGKSEVNELLDAYKDDVIAEWKRTRDAGDGRPRLTPEEKAELNETAPETPEPQAESAGEPEKPAEPAQATPELGPVDAPMPEPVEMPKTRQGARKAAKARKAAAMPKTKRNRKPTFSYICELEDGSKITLDSIAEVKARRDVLTCRIEPVKKSRKAA
ncbi:MAG: hypothetical protein J6Y54_00940 [Lentisphaeria bacterium]|nr:hypothetical protein [Lentisphaeria bacterium]